MNLASVRVLCAFARVSAESGASEDQFGCCAVDGCGELLYRESGVEEGAEASRNLFDCYGSRASAFASRVHIGARRRCVGTSSGRGFIWNGCLHDCSKSCIKRTQVKRVQ